jgi:hypothetical protein
VPPADGSLYRSLKLNIANRKKSYSYAIQVLKFEYEYAYEYEYEGLERFAGCFGFHERIPEQLR